MSDRAVDVLVVGGGITGVGIALDAVTRGYRVALVERHDLASGTSSRSSKLVHGGVRYLAQHDFALVREAARERDRLRRIAPHLARPLPFVVPAADRRTDVELHAGLLLYGLLSFWGNVERFEGLGADDVQASAPLVDGFQHGGVRYWDARTDDARLTLQVARTAAAHGALVANHAEVVGLRRVAGRVVGARVRDRLGSGEFDVDARWVVSATGVWADRVRGLAGDVGGRLTPSKGVHLAFPHAVLPVHEAVVVPSGAGDGRMVFVVPWGQQVYVGTTDQRHDGALDEVTVLPHEAGYLLHALDTNFGFRGSLADAVGAWAGLRPLLAPPGGAPNRTPADLSRRHAVAEDPPGLLTVTGGKLTTFRQMAQDVVDRIATADDNRAPCVTARLPLGVHGTLEHALARVRGVCELFGLDPALAEPLLHRHGDQAAEVVALAAEHDETAELFVDLPYLQGEVRWAVRHEFARTLDDVLQRRMRVSLRRRDAGGSAVRAVLDILASELGWDRAERARQLDGYLRAVRTERGVVPVDLSWQGADRAATDRSITP